jgi:acid phosphatase (class A)
MKLLSLSVLSLGLLAALPAFGADAAFVTAAQTHVVQILPAPPLPDADITRAELAQLHQLQASRTPAQVARAIADDKEETIFLYRDVLGEKFDPAALPLTKALAARVKHDEASSTLPAKAEFHRVRPYNLDKTLQPICKTKTKDDSYPSGHTTAGYLAALALIEMVPEQRDAILARAAEYGNNRLVCGVHFASDVQASKVLAYAIHAAMDSNPQFNVEMRAARAELRTALALPAMAD